MEIISRTKISKQSKTETNTIGIVCFAQTRWAASSPIPSPEYEACRRHHLKVAEQWLGKAIDLAGKKEVRVMALEDKDLEPLWAKIVKA